MHCAEREERMVDAVVGQNCHRPLRSEAPLEECLGDPAHRAVRFAVAQLSPALTRALGEKGPLRSLVGPLHQPFGDATRIGGELLRRAQQHRAVGTLLHLDLLRRELHSALMPASFAICAQRSDSCAMRTPSTCGVDRSAKAPCALKASSRSLEASAVFSISLSFAIAAPGVPAGARTKRRGEASKPGRVSASAGQSAPAILTGLVSAIGRRRPAFDCASTGGALMMPIWSCPEMTSGMIAEAPL